MRIIGFIGIVLGAIFICAWFLFPRLFSGEKGGSATYSVPIKVGNASLSVEIADTYYSRAQGLSGRSGLEDNQGMLFVFPRPDDYGFWMRGMTFPIDIIWIDEFKKVVFISRNISPETYPSSIRSDQAAKYVLETSAGWAEHHDIRLSDALDYDE